MGRHKWKRENGEGLFDLAKNLGKKAAEAALKKAVEKVEEDLEKTVLGKHQSRAWDKVLSEARTRGVN